MNLETNLKRGRRLQLFPWALGIQRHTCSVSPSNHSHSMVRTKWSFSRWGRGIPLRSHAWKRKWRNSKPPGSVFVHTACWWNENLWRLVKLKAKCHRALAFEIQQAAWQNPWRRWTFGGPLSSLARSMLQKSSTRSVEAEFQKLVEALEPPHAGFKRPDRQRARSHGSLELWRAGGRESSALGNLWGEFVE